MGNVVIDCQPTKLELGDVYTCLLVRFSNDPVLSHSNHHVDVSPSSLFHSTLSTSLERITVRQIRDPYAANVEEIACYKVRLENNGDLNVKDIHVGVPGDKFFVRVKTVLVSL